MSISFYTTIALFFCLSVSAQSGKISITGRLPGSYTKKAISLSDLDGMQRKTLVKPGNTFTFLADSITRGFYEIEGMGTIYVSPGYQLTVVPAARGTFHFTGKGALENNAFVSAKNSLSRFFPLTKEGGLTQADYFMDVPVFLQKIDSFQQYGTLLFKKSTDTFFVKYATLDLQFYCKHLLSDYNTLYGIDPEKLLQLPDVISKLDKKDPAYLTNVMRISDSPQVKKMNPNERIKLSGLIYTNWDKNNEILFRSSQWYRKAFENFFMFMSYNPKYFKMTMDEATHYNPIGSDVRTLAVVNGEITNPYIRSYFDYVYTRSILQKTHDTTELKKYYDAYQLKASRKDYLQDVQEIYANAVSYTDNSNAPAFSYKDVSGKLYSLQDLAGKYVYIDVWATWCGPCKAEIPYLKKIEETFSNKNIQFVSISVDEQHNTAKWKAYVIKNKLGGLQLITDNAFETSFIKKMSINSIPRFILVDPAGKLISADALRPSDDKLKAMLTTLLQ